MTDAEELHVHFDEDNDGLKTNNVVVRKKGDRKIEIQLGKLVKIINEFYGLLINAWLFVGFLQVHHSYEVTVVVDRTFFPTNCLPR